MFKIALLGNPNVGKSTLFNALTGLSQHTGNWAGKTVSNASGKFTYENKEYIIYDLPGTYSLIANSKEEEVARDFICFEEYDVAIVVCDATCLERNLILVLQTLQITKKVIVCINLMDEAYKKGITIDIPKLQELLGVPVVGITARSKENINDLLSLLNKNEYNPKVITYEKHVQEYIDIIKSKLPNIKNNEWIAINLINCDDKLYNSIKNYLGYDIKKEILMIKEEITVDDIVVPLVLESSKIASKVIKNKEEKTFKIDYFLTNKLTGIPIMILLLLVIFWITIKGANYPSSLLLNLFSKIEIKLIELFTYLNIPIWIKGLFIDGVYKVLSTVVSVMLPPMAIFFPLFTILEDLGYLPRIAFNLDNIFHKCQACGKQALTMCMGFGCNAVGVSGARIIDSPRERLIAILTNAFVPCNGRFPTIIMIITMFFVGLENNLFNSFLNVLLLTLIILLGILMTFIVSKILSKTILKGMPSSFTLELPSYRKPQIMKVIIRSFFDRTIHVLKRAIIVAIPAGALIWILVNIKINNFPLINYMANFLNPLANLMGLDGIILISFILGFPANEIVIPIMLMIYTSEGTIVDMDNLFSLKEILINNGWTIKTAICTILFSLFHFPCSTTCLTIKKETSSLKWTFLAILIPTIIGILICMLVNLIL